MTSTQHRCSPTALGCVSRRALLAASGAAGVLTLAACGSDGGTPPSGGTTTPGGTAGNGVIASLADIPVGGAITATTSSGEAILLTQPTEGEVHAFSSVCTHQGCAVEPGDGELECPCHGSRYDLTTAEVLGGPAPSPLPEITIEVSENGEITG